MIETYFAQVEGFLQAFPHIRAYTLRKKVYNSKQGCIGGTITFEDGRRLDFVEVKDVEVAEKLKYRYQYMDENHALIFRYDNAPHYKSMQTFPHHKHTLSEVQTSPEPTLHDVLLEIARIERESIKFSEILYRTFSEMSVFSPVKGRFSLLRLAKFILSLSKDEFCGSMTRDPLAITL